MLEVARWHSELPDYAKLPVLWDRKLAELILDRATRSAPGKLDGLGIETINALTIGEVAFLYECWSKIVQDVDPDADTMTEEEFFTLLADLKKKPELVNDCSLREYRKIALAYLDEMKSQEASMSTPS